MTSEDAGEEKARASFRLVGDVVNPTLITEMLGIVPTHAHAKGESVPDHPDWTYHTGVWVVESTLPCTALLDDQVRQLLDLLSSKTDRVRELQDIGCSVSFFCGYHFSMSQGGGVDMQPETLEGIANLGAMLELFVFWMGDG